MKLFFPLWLASSLIGCIPSAGKEDAPLKEVIMRYNMLLAEGYRKLNMNPLQEVATREQAEKLYFHMAAIGEGRLRLESTLKDIKFVKVVVGKDDQATAETKEIWDFTHIDINTGSKFAEEKDFIYEIGYTLKKLNGRWLITNVATISGTSTNTVIPWPQIDRKGQLKRPVTPPVGHH